MNAADFQKKLFEQPFTVIILVLVLVFQNQLHVKQVARLHSKEDSIHTEYESMVKEDREVLLNRSESLVEAIKGANIAKDKDKEELFETIIATQKELFEKLIECEKSKK